MRGYTPEGFRLFAERIGVAKADSWIDYSVLEDCMRTHLNEIAQRRIAVLDPIKLVIDNYPDDREEECQAPNHPQRAELGRRVVPFARELWIESLGMPAVLPPPEEEKKVKTAIGASRAEQSRDDML